MRGLVVVVIVVMLVAAGCSGSGGDVSGGAVDDGVATVDLSIVVDAATVSAIDSCVEALGPEDAFRGVLFALDNGYDVGQVTAGMGDGTLDGDGVIRGVEPAGAMVGIIDRSGPSARGAIVLAAGPVIVAGERNVTAEEFKLGLAQALSAVFSVMERRGERGEAAQETLVSAESRAMIGTMVGLVSAGYTLDQVVEAVVFGEGAIPIPVPGKRLCLVIHDARGESVLPINDPVDGLCSDFYDAMRRAKADNDTTTTTTEPAATTGTIIGVVLDIETAGGVPGATVTVTPDGSATVTDGDGVFTLGEIQPGTYTVTVTAEGFPEAAAEVTVVGGEVSDTTIGLDKDDELPWVFEGTSTAVLTAGHPFGSGASFVITSLVHVTITLNADGTAVFYREFPDTYKSLTVDCEDRTAYVSTRSGLPPQTTTGTHSEGEFEVPMGDAAVTGTYTSSEIQGRWTYEITTDWCDDPTPRSWKVEYGFGPDGMERVYDTP